MVSPDLFTVIIPLYNKSAYILRAIVSVLNQTYQAFTLIIINDGSTDDSLEIAKSIHDCRIKIFSQENRGVSAARNRGIELSSSQYVAFLDADDEWKPTFLEKIMSLCEKYPQCGFYGTSYESINTDGEIMVHQSPIISLGWNGVVTDFFELLSYSYFINSSCVVFNKKYLQAAGLFPEGVRHGEDISTWIHMSLIAPIAYENTSLSIYHRDTDSSSSDQYGWETEFYPVTILRGLIREKKIPSFSIGHAYDYIARINMMTAKRMFQAGKPLCALRVLWICRKSKQHRNKIIPLIKKQFLAQAKLAFLKNFLPNIFPFPVV